MMSQKSYTKPGKIWSMLSALLLLPGLAFGAEAAYESLEAFQASPE